MKKITKGALWGGVLLSLASAAVAKPSQEFAGVYAFGDEFTRSDNAWASYLSRRYGFNFVAGAQNFALDRNRSAHLGAQLATYRARLGGFNPEAVYALYVGPRDYLGNPLAGVDGYSASFWNDVAAARIGGVANLAARARAGTLAYDRATFPATYASVENSGLAVANFVQSLQRCGVNYMVVLNHFNETL